MRHATSGWRRIYPATFLRAIIVVGMVGGMALQEIGAGESFTADLTGESLS